MKAPKSLLISSLLLCSCSTPNEAYRNRLDSWDRLQRDEWKPREETSAGWPDQAGLPELLAYARVHNPALQAAFEGWRIALEQVTIGSALPNPRLTLGGYLSEVETRVGPIDGSIGIAQPLPWFGKLQLQGDMAFEASEAAREQLEDERLSLDQRLRDAWYEYSWVEQAILITQRNQELLAHWESVARSRNATGLGNHADVIRAQVELGKLEDRVQTLKDLRRPLEARVNAALNRPSAALLPKPLAKLPEAPELDEALLAAALEASNPKLRAMHHRIRSSELGVDLADKAFYPDLVLGVDYTLVGSAINPALSGSGEDAIALKLGIDLPIWRSKLNAGARASEALARQARLEQSDMLNQLQAELEMALYQFRDADRRVELFNQSLIPKGEESIQALDIAYQSGDQGFLDLIDAQRVLLEFQLQAVRASSDRARAVAKLMMVSGVVIPLEN